MTTPLREMRLLNLLHGGTGFETEVTRADVLRMALHHGRSAVTNRNTDAALSIGSPADLLVIDWDRVDDDRLRGDLDPRDLLFAPRPRRTHCRSSGSEDGRSLRMVACSVSTFLD